MADLGYYYDPVLGRVVSNSDPTPQYGGYDPFQSNPFGIGMQNSSNDAYTRQLAADQALRDYYATTYANSPSVQYTDPNIAAYYQQQAGSVAGNPGTSPTGYGTAGFNMASDPAYAGSYNSAVPNPNQPPSGAQATGVPGVYVLPWGGTWIQPGIDQQAAFAAYQNWARQQPGFSWNGVGTVINGSTGNATSALPPGSTPTPTTPTPTPSLPQLTQQLQGYLSSIDAYIRTLPQYQGGPITDEVRRQFHFPTSTELQMNMQYYQNNPNAHPSGITGGAGSAPFIPTGNAPTGFNWNWIDPDAAGPNPGNWALSLAGQPTTYQEYQDILNTKNSAAYGNKFFSIPAALQFMFNSPLTESQFGSLSPLYSDSSQAAYNQQLNDAIKSFLPPNLQNPTAEQQQNPAFILQWQQAADSLRQSLGLPTWSQLQQGIGAPRNNVNSSWFAYDPGGLNVQNAPYLPNAAPASGFLYQWTPNVTGSNGPGAWAQVFNGAAPTNQAGIDALLSALNANPGALYNGLPTGFGRTTTPTGPRWSYTAPASSSNNLFGGGGNTTNPIPTTSSQPDFSALINSIFGGGGNASTQSVSQTLNTNQNTQPTGPWSWSDLTSRPGANTSTQNLW